MSPDERQVEHVRQVIAASGGWNRRSRGALLAWAKAEGLDDRRLEHLLVRALALQVPVPDARARMQESAPPVHERSHPRWWLAVLACVGLAVSALLVVRLAPQVEVGAPRPIGTRTDAKSAPVVEPARTLPPAPVSFPTPPQLEATALAPAPTVMAPLGARPVGTLARAPIQSWRDAFAAAASAWPTMTPAERISQMDALAAWLAASGPADLVALQAAEREVIDRLQPRERELAEAWQGMLAAQVAAGGNVSSAVAADPAFAAAARLGPARALQSWASARAPALASNLGAADARARWTAWLQAVATIEPPSERTALALSALDAIVRGGARIDGQGLAADAAGSLLAGIPARPDQPGFAAVRDAWIAWLRDGAIPSARLWALGGIWRARVDPPDAWLLPGERDGPKARAALAERWARLASARTEPAWTSLLAKLGRTVPRSSDTRLDARIADLTDRARLARQAESPDALAVDAAVESAPTDAPAPTAAPESRWARQLADPIAETRQRALRELRTEAPEALAAADAAALAARAIGAQSRDERALAQEIIRGPLADTTEMRDAMTREVALCADPRLVADFLERLLARDLPADDATELRAAALSALLAAHPLEGEALAAEAARARLAAELRAWAPAESPRAPEADPARIAWPIVARACDEARAIHPPPLVQPLAAGLADRLRRLERIAPTGPRGLAAALALLCDTQAVRLSAQHASQAEALRALADAAALRRSRANDSIEQAAISLDALAAMRLLARGAPVPVPSEAHPAEPPTKAAQEAARLEIERAEALLNSSPVDRKRFHAAVRHAAARDPAVTGSVALLLAQAADTAPQRRHWLEAATLLGEGSTVDAEDPPDAADGIALAQLLAWSDRGQTDRLVTAKLPERMRPAAEAFAAACGSSLEECLGALRQSGTPQRARVAERLRLAALQALDPTAAGWLGAIAACDAGPLPECDAAQPWRIALPGS